MTARNTLIFEPRWAGLLAGLLLAFGTSDARAISVADLQPGACLTLNAANKGANLANALGYTGSPYVDVTTGTLNIGGGSQVIELPPNGIICVAALTCTSSGTLTFTRNDANTPVYLVVEGDATMSHGCDIDVSGAAQINIYGIGMDHLGGLAGPGGSDGGSCDFIWSNPPRAGAGIGPGGGGAASDGPGGGGASPVASGGDGHGVTGALGGQLFSGVDDRIMHGGAGGGCGATTSGTSPTGGGGGGGVFVLGAGGAITINSGSEIRARGGAGNTYGGGGGGGAIRLVAGGAVTNSGQLYVEGGPTCAQAYCGGEGGDGLVKVTANVAGSTEVEVAPSMSVRPSLEVIEVSAVWNGATDTRAPEQFNARAHSHKNTGIVIEAPAQEQTVTVSLRSVNILASSTVRVRLNTLYDDDAKRSLVTSATTTGSGSGTLNWTAALTVPAGLALGTIEAWVCSPTAGVPCN